MSYLYDHDCDCGSTVCVSAMAPLIGPGHVAAATTSKVHYTRPRIVTLHNGRWQWTVEQRDDWTVGHARRRLQCQSKVVHIFCGRATPTVDAQIRFGLLQEN